MRRRMGSLLLAAWLLLPGCASFKAPRPTGPSVGWAEAVTQGGWSYRLYPAALEPLESAALESLADLRFWDIRIEESKAGAAERKITARSQDGRPASLLIRPVPNGAQVAARVGHFGDASLAKLLVDRVGVRLGFLPPAVLPRELPSGQGSTSARAGVPDAVMLREQAGSQYGDGFVP